MLKIKPFRVFSIQPIQRNFRLLIYIIDVDIIDATEDARCIDRGYRCVFRGWDPEGDALLRLGARKAVVFREEIDKLSLE